MCGNIIKITFVIQYPDGSEKIAEMEGIDNVNAIYFKECVMNEEMSEKFTVSQNWTRNPAMIVHSKEGVFANCKINQYRINWVG